MTLLVTDAVVLHVFPYLESSRIVRLATREAGVQSVLARGARRPKSRFGSALDLYAEGVAHISMRPSRDLQTLSGFETTQSRSRIGEDLGRFTGAATVAELALRCATEETTPALFDAVNGALEAIADAEPATAGDATLGAAWRLMAALGFCPSLDNCATCHTRLPADTPLSFGHRAGGGLCPRCAPAHRPVRRLPADAVQSLRTWLSHGDRPSLGVTARRAHQRLLREFIYEHVAEGRAFPAFEMWQRETCELVT
jgi:DNA repair protein RecO (recombination protein O)